MVRASAHPVAGYPSKTAAVVALRAANVPVEEIAERLEITKASVYALIAYAKRKPPRVGAAVDVAAAESTAPDTRGLWTTEKLEKARRLIGKSVILIAEALQVPADELLLYGLKGIIPPMGASQRIGDLLSQIADGAPTPDEPLALPPPAAEGDEPTREDDEAELAALEEAPEDADPEPEPEPDAQTDRLCALKNDNGEFLHEHEGGFTRLPRFMWRGTADEVAALKARKPDFSGLEEVWP